MENLTHYPLLLFVASFVALWLAALAGSWLRRRNPGIGDDLDEHMGVLLAATLTLLALIIGFSFSMATNRYDQRKNFEESEANAIGTEMLRADLLPGADAAIVRKLLGVYLNQRIQFYLNEDDVRRIEINRQTTKLQADLWLAVRGAAVDQPGPIQALVLSGMNDVINSQGYTQAAFWKSNSHSRMVADGGDRAVCQFAVWLSFNEERRHKEALHGAAVPHLDCRASDRRYRCPEAWPHSRQAPESRSLATSLNG